MLGALALNTMGGDRSASGELAQHPTEGGWERLERVGEGASAVVWRARHPERGQLVALKVARPEPAARDAVAREALLLARVGRRWGPALVDAGPGFLASEWIRRPSARIRLALPLRASTASSSRR